MDTKPAQNNGVARRVLIGGLWAGSLCWFARDAQRVFGSRSRPDDEKPIAAPVAEPISVESPFENYAEQTHIVAMVGEPVICDILTLHRDPLMAISYMYDQTISVRNRNGYSIVPVKERSQHETPMYKGHHMITSNVLTTKRSGSILSYTVNRAFSLNKPGEYTIAFHLNMPWRDVSKEDQERQKMYWESMGDRHGEGEMPQMPVSHEPEHPYQTTVTVYLTLLPTDQDVLIESARRTARDMVVSLLDTKDRYDFLERWRRIEAFWCYPDNVLIPVAEQELLPLKRKLEKYAADMAQIKNGYKSLYGEAQTVAGSLADILSPNYCPPLSPARQELVLWLTEEARSGANGLLRRHVQTSVKDAPRQV